MKIYIKKYSLFIMLIGVTGLYADITVEISNETKYGIYGNINWKEGCDKDSFFVHPYKTTEVSWSNFLGLGKTCEFDSIDLNASVYKSGGILIIGSWNADYNTPVVDRFKSFYQFKEHLSVGKKGKNELGGACKNVKLFIKETTEKSLTIDHRCFD